MAQVPQLSDGHRYVGTVLSSSDDGSEAAGFMLMATCGDFDVLFWACAYLISPANHTQWLVPGGRMHGTIFMAARREPEPQLGDNGFARRGLHLPEYLDSSPFDVNVTENDVTWAVDGRRYQWTEDGWRIEGEHGGVDVELTLRPAGEPMWSWGPFENIVENAGAGYDVPITGTGTVSVAGRRFELANAVGSHERSAIGQGRDIVAEVSGGSEVFVGDCFADDLHIVFGEHTGRGMAFGRIEVGGQATTVSPLTGQGVMSVTTLERWHDPRSGLFLPARWRIVMAADGASVELDVRAEARAYWQYTTRSGVMVMVWQLSRATGVAYLPGGERREIHDVLTASRWGRALLVAEETAVGPRFVVREELLSAVPG